MNIDIFRQDLLDYVESTNTKPHALSRASRVDAASLYKFLSGESALSAESIFRLWPFVYRHPQRTKAVPISRARRPATSLAPVQGSGDAA